jgi:hypothetical protein
LPQSPADVWAQFDLDIADWQARRIAANIVKLVIGAVSGLF